MLMVHVPNKKFSGTPDCEYYEFSDNNIKGYITDSMHDDEFVKLMSLFEISHFPKHVGNFVRTYVEKNSTKELLDSICKEEYSVADEMIRNALKAYTELTLKQRIKLHTKELDNIRKQLRQESRIRLS
jgi:hypothetical protein